MQFGFNANRLRSVYSQQTKLLGLSTSSTQYIKENIDVRCLEVTVLVKLRGQV